jgi:hypothetical protein
MSVAVAIEVKGLGKIYDSVIAVKNLSLTVEQGGNFRTPGTQRSGQQHHATNFDYDPQPHVRDCHHLRT